MSKGVLEVSLKPSSRSIEKYEDGLPNSTTRLNSSSESVSLQAGSLATNLSKKRLEYTYDVVRETACLFIKFKKLNEAQLKQRCKKYNYQWIEMEELKIILNHVSNCQLWATKYRREADNLYEALFCNSTKNDFIYVCDQCNPTKNSPKSRLLQPLSEIRQQLPDNTSGPCVCPITSCGRSFFSMNDLGIHINIVHLSPRKRGPQK